MGTTRVVRKAYGKYKKEHCIVQFNKSRERDFEIWCMINLEKLFNKHGHANIEIRR